MLRSWFALSVFGLVCSACGSDSSNSPGSAGSGNAGGAGNSGCPDVSGSWNITEHCEHSLIGTTLTVTQNACALSFSAPFDGFSGSVTTDGKITVGGPQDCTGTATTSAITMNCTPSTCVVKLAR
ncbi:MAG TPA: hypothetical protein VER11_25980 [Polyangiaceae bacterium]|nr:hypothetical protein [Polyangiaceae bacterium]